MGFKQTARDAGPLRWTAVFLWKFIAFATLIGVLYQRSHDMSLHVSPARVRRQVTMPNVISPTTTASLRDTASTNETSESDDGIYPPDLLTDDQILKGGFILYAFGLFYMFCALAIVCDEFFVPALEVLTTKMKISDDVAGATMMAAGGSAPELFTSVIGVFFAKSDVGIGTIVGSAVFNVLFVIAMCALFSKEVLQPLFRDCTFYIISLATLIYSFYDSKIEWWESLMLLICYASYVIFMKYNMNVEQWVKSKLNKNGGSTESISVKVCPADGEVRKDGDSTKGEAATKEQVSKSLDHDQVGAPAPSSGGGFHSGLFNLMIHSLDPAENDEQTGTNYAFNRLKQAGRNLSTDKLTANAASLSMPVDSKNGHAAAKNDSSMAPISEEKQNGNGHANLTAVPPVSAGSQNQISDTTLNVSSDSDNDADFLDMSWPTGDWKKQAIYVFLFGITGPLYILIPDVRRPGKEKWVVLTFLNSILAIAIYSYLMVWFASVLGRVFQIPIEVMGLTFLAAGTSVPDLITSVIVAKKGLGDMAVSSSIGSNIFDVTVGLPLPWLISSLINGGQEVTVQSEGMLCSISMLFLMLVAVFSSIACYKWRMTKGLGLAMFVLYGIFLAVSLTLEIDNGYSCFL